MHIAVIWIFRHWNQRRYRGVGSAWVAALAKYMPFLFSYLFPLFSFETQWQVFVKTVIARMIECRMHCQVHAVPWMHYDLKE